MNILVLNGSPRAKGNTKQMMEAFRAGAVSSGQLKCAIDRLYSTALFSFKGVLQ